LEKLEENTRLCMDTIAAYEPHFGKVCPSLMMSPTFRSSRERGVDVYEGGAKYNNTSVVGAGLATLTDSLTVIKRAVFEEKSMTLSELREILKRNWEGAELLRQSLRKRCAHFGNNDAEADEIAQRIYLCFASCINQTKNARGGVFRCGVFSVDWREWMGKKTLATPDGRLAGEPISKNLAPCTGQDKKGVTAYLQSLLKLDATQMPDGGVADVVLHGSTVRGEEGLQAFHALLKTFMNGGGFAVHFNILRPEELKKAQKEPEKYKNLQIRLCGWNARFVELSRAWQDEFIKQSENGM
jgi:formate C-acetyltransferase